jgi:hypothetical protein
MLKYTMRLSSVTATLVGLLLLGAACGQKAAVNSGTSSDSGLKKVCSTLATDAASGALYDCALNGESYYFIDSQAYLRPWYDPYAIYNRSGKEVALCTGGDPDAARKDDKLCVGYPFVDHGATCTNITDQCQ